MVPETHPKDASVFIWFKVASPSEYGGQPFGARKLRSTSARAAPPLARPNFRHEAILASVKRAPACCTTMCTARGELRNIDPFAPSSGVVSHSF